MRVQSLACVIALFTVPIVDHHVGTASPAVLAMQDTPGVRLQENADCGGRGFGVNPPRDFRDFNQFGVSCIDVIARTPTSWVIFYSQTDFHGSELRVRGAWRNANIANIVKKNGPCILGATTGPPGNWNDEIRSFKFVDSYDADGCGTNCPPPGVNGRCDAGVGAVAEIPLGVLALFLRPMDFIAVGKHFKGSSLRAGV